MPTLALLVVGVVGTFVLLTLPVFVGGIVNQFGWGDKEVGWLASADMAGSALASLIALTFIGQLNWKKATFTAIIFAVVGNLASIYADGFASLMAVRTATGFCNGIVLSIVFVGLCHSSNPERFFGIYVFTQLTLQALLLAALPIVIDAFGMPAIYVTFATASGLSSLLVMLFPESTLRHSGAGLRADRPYKTVNHQSNPASLSNWAIVALAGQAIYFLAPAAMWGYFQPIGVAFSLNIADIGRALGIASIAGIAGSFLVIVLGARFDRVLCMAMGTLVSVTAVVLLADGSGFLWYLVATSLFSFAWNYTFPYQMGVLALFNNFGSVAILSLVVQLSGLALGPMLASFLLFGDGYGFILWTCVPCYVVSFVMFMLANSRHMPVLESLP